MDLGLHLSDASVCFDDLFLKFARVARRGPSLAARTAACAALSALVAGV
jgi:hypothetical protein